MSYEKIFCHTPYLTKAQIYDDGLLLKYCIDYLNFQYISPFFMLFDEVDDIPQ